MPMEMDTILTREHRQSMDREVLRRSHPHLTPHHKKSGNEFSAYGIFRLSYENLQRKRIMVMHNQTINGKLKHWNADKGFGFIAAGGEVGDVFIHISTLKQMSRAPMVGDIIYFQFKIQADGKKRAVTARIEGVEAKTAAVKPPRNNNHNSTASGRNKSLVYLLLILVVIAGVGRTYFNQPAPSAPRHKPQTIQPKSNFRCEGKKHCSQMRSYAEALFYTQNCPNTKMDGDLDGDPCERQSFPDRRR
ncbi:MAG: cold shock CspA family protein [Phenylobacterium sp.]|jgi:cold shock CspA family protein